MSAALGRPRDPSLDSRIREAAAAVYAEAGWVGFNFDIIARRAAVGKSAVYRRWSSREDLLIDAIRRVDISTVIDGLQDVRAVCAALLKSNLEWWGGVRGAAYLRLQIDQVSLPFLGALYEARVVSPLMEGIRAVLKEAEARGEVPPGSSASMLAEALFGMPMIRMAASTAAERRRLLTNADEYVDRVVEFLVAGVSATAKR